MAADAPLATSDTTYRIVQRNHVNQWSNELQTAVPGWDIRALWISTGTVLPVFVPDSQYTADNVDKMIRHAGAIDEQIHGLGS